MTTVLRLFRRAAILAALALLSCASPQALADGSEQVPILVYHRFGPAASDRMTVTTPVFESQLDYLRTHGYTVIPLKRLVDHLRGEAPPPPPHAVVITADDGHRSVYTDMFPVVRRFGVPVTLFVYPSAISNASYALTWPQLAELKQSGLFDIQSHSYWHPRFDLEKGRLAPREYERFVAFQLAGSKAKIETCLGTLVEMLAWPFGVYDEELMQEAAETGYIAAFTLERRPASAAEKVMALPRYRVTDADRGEAFGRLLAASR